MAVQQKNYNVSPVDSVCSALQGAAAIRQLGSFVFARNRLHGWNEASQFAIDTLAVGCTFTVQVFPFQMIRVFIGYDPRETVAYHALSHSIHRHASAPVSIAPLMLTQLRDVYRRTRDPLQSTDFSFSRFLVPYLCGFDGWAIFMDCDMLMRDDVAKLWALRDAQFAVQVVKHAHIPRETVKFLGQPQTAYPKKNWSSVMLMNNGKCTALTPELVNQASGLHLHRFEWLADESAVGSLPNRWNHLVGYDLPNPDAGLAHFTLGGPYFSEYVDCEFSGEWMAMRDDMLKADQHK